MVSEITKRLRAHLFLPCLLIALFGLLPDASLAQTSNRASGQQRDGSAVNAREVVPSSASEDKKTTASERVDPPSAERSVPAALSSDAAPLTDRERAMLDLIRDLQERVAKLESQNTSPVITSNAPGSAPRTPGALGLSPALISSTNNSSATVVGGGSPASSGNGITPRINPEISGPSVRPDGSPDVVVQADERKIYGSYTPNLGYKLVNTEHGDLNLSIYTYVRYLNQLALNDTYTDAFGNLKNVQNRQDVQIQKLQFKFLGWVMSPKLRYFLYAWTSNATQGQGAQVVLAGNLSYQFSKYFTFAGGIRSLPGTRSVEGNFPFWFGVDSRHIADEFMRPSYTSGIWATGDITDRLEYQVMLGNNMSTLGVPATRLDSGLNTFSSSLVWYPTGDFARGFSGQGWGDLEDHQKFSTRFGFHFSRSNENKESQPGSDVFENTQLRLSDGTVIFTPNLFGQGTTITDARYRMSTVDGGFKYHGYSLEGEYFWRWLDDFKGPGTAGLKGLFDHGFQLQGSAMVVPQVMQLYVGHSKIFGQYGKPWDLRIGTNYFPFKNHVIRWNTEALYLYKSPVGYTSVPFVIGGKGWVFHTSFELAF
jgi:hypothetical protein